MPRSESRCLVWAFAASLALWVILGQGQREASANLRYQGSWEIVENEQGSLQQSYNQMLGLSSRQEVNDRLNLEENLNYHTRWEEGGAVTEIISPGAALRLSGDIFSGSLAFDSKKNLNSLYTQTDSETLTLVWASAWRKRWYPSFQSNYDYNRQSTDALNSQYDEDRQSLGVSINWDLLVAQLHYAYRRTDGNYIGYKDINDSHFARINVARGWWDNRLRVSLGQEYSKADSERRVSFVAAPTVKVALTFSQVDTGTDPTPTDTDDSMLVAAPSLLNNDLLTTVYSLTAAGSPNCIRLRANGQQVDRIFLYTPTKLDTSPPGLNFRVYTNDNIIVNPWDQVVAITWQYEANNQRFVIDLPAVQANYLKVVVDLAGLGTLDLTEVQAEQVVHGEIGSTLATLRTNQNDRSSLNLDFRLSKSVAFFFSLYQEKEKTNGVIMNDRQGYNGGVRMQNAAGDLKSTLNYNSSRQRAWHSPEAQNDSYQLNVNKVLLPTLTLALSGSRDDNYLDGVKVSTRNRYTFYADATLYPDLTSQMEVGYWDQKNFEALTGEQDNINTKITITSRVSPSLNVSLYEIYDVHNQTEQESKTQNTLGLSGNWQVSNLLSIFAGTTRVNGNQAPDSSTYSAGLSAGIGSGWELKASYALLLTETKSQSGMVALRWATTRNVSWEIGCNYVESDLAAAGNLYKMYSQLAVNFATR